MVDYLCGKSELPCFPENVEPWFRELCQVVPIEELGELRCSIDKFLLAVRKSSELNANVDLEVAERCSAAMQLLLDRYVELDDEGKGLVVGAIRYFTTDDDPLPDTVFATGFDDDVAVINYVLGRLGMSEYAVLV